MTLVYFREEGKLACIKVGTPCTQEALVEVKLTFPSIRGPILALVAKTNA